jgi:hypothetical protein
MPNLKIGPPTAPPVLAKAPHALIRALDVADLFMSAVGTPKAPMDLGPIIAYNSIESYLDAAKRQQRRIERARAATVKDVFSRKHTHGNLFNEVHFYLICWARIAKLARFIVDKTRFKRVGLVLRRYHIELKDRIDCRDHLEHFEERLPGGARQNKLLVPSDLLNMIGEHVTYGGRKLDVGPASIRLLQTIVNELRTALLFDGIETLATADPNRLSSLIQRAASKVQIARVTRAVQNTWKQANPQRNR